MKFLGFVLVICAIHCECYAQSNTDDKKAIAMLNEFYTAHGYIWSGIKSLPPNVFDRKLDSLQKKYCTTKLRNEARKYIQDGFDHMTKDKGIDSDAVKTMTIVKDATKENTYIISYDELYNTGSPNSFVKKHVTLHLGVIKDVESYKIASVN
jgi:hypothetical protein